MERRNVDILGKLDWLTLLIVLVIMICGWFSICGASADLENPQLFSFATRPGKQMVWILCSLALCAVVLFITQNFYNSYSYLIYVAFLVLLLVTIFVASDTKGSRSWLHLGPVSLQPAEFAKFATALALARYVDRYDFNPHDMGDLLKACAIFAAPMLLIVLQNETGSALVYVAFLLVLYREGMTGSVLFLGVCAVVFFILEIKFGVVELSGQPFKMGTWLVLTLIQLLESLIIWNMSKDRKLTFTVLGIGLGGMLLGLAVSSAIIPFKVTLLQSVLILITSIYIIFRAFKDIARHYMLAAAFGILTP